MSCLSKPKSSCPESHNTFVGGATIRGGRKHNEDLIDMRYEESIHCLFMAVFDGHGGIEAAKYAKETLWENIKGSKGFGSDYPTEMMDAITEGFRKTQKNMWEAAKSWKKNKDGSTNMSGTTATCAIIQRKYVYIANVGDSTMIIATENPKHGDDKPEEPKVIAEELTVRHRPHDVNEKTRIEALGGSVLSYNNGVYRVFKPTPMANKEFPKLNMSRSLGDLWSITDDNQYIISPIPDVSVRRLDRTKDKYIILGSDGLWNVVTPQMSIKTVNELCEDDVNSLAEVCKVVEGLISHAQREWDRKMKRADNIAVLMVFFAKRYAKEETSSPFRDQHRGQPQNPIPPCASST